MRVVEVAGRADLAQVFVLQMRPEPWSCVECVGAIDPAVAPEDKLVLMISSQFGCPVGCAMCDAGGWYEGNLTRIEILAQIQHLLETWAGPNAAACPKLKIQFARMGEPALNPAVLEAIESLRDVVRTPGLMPCVATTAPRAGAGWLEQLLRLRQRLYAPTLFQLQFSVQSTDETVRDRMIPVPKWTLGEIAQYAKRFVMPGGRTVTLNLALAHQVPVSLDVLARTFSPETCAIKLTPLNPTQAAATNMLRSAFTTGQEDEICKLAEEIRTLGFACIVSVGDPEESRMGTSCGQMARLAVPGRSGSYEVTPTQS